VFDNEETSCTFHTLPSAYSCLQRLHAMVLRSLLMVTLSCSRQQSSAEPPMAISCASSPRR
jgi:hypothetical protein